MAEPQKFPYTILASWGCWKVMAASIEDAAATLEGHKGTYQVIFEGITIRSKRSITVEVS